MRETHEPEYGRGDKVTIDGKVATVLMAEVRSMQHSGDILGVERYIFSAYTEPALSNDFFCVLKLDGTEEVQRHIHQDELSEYED